MNNNSPSKGNGYVRFTKRDSDGQDASLIEHEDNGDLFKRSSSPEEMVANGHQSHGHARHLRSRVTIDRVGDMKFKQSHSTSCKLKCFVFLCGAIIVVGMALILHFYHNRTKVISIGDGSLGLAQLCLSDKTLTILDHERTTKAVISLGGEKFPSLKYKDAENCGDSSATMSGMCLKWPSHGTSLRVNPVTLKNVNHMGAAQCYKVSWSFKPDFSPEDCIFLDEVEEDKKIENSVWLDTQKYVLWPERPTQQDEDKEKSICTDSCQKYMPGGVGSATGNSQKNMGGTVVEPMWISSQSVLIKASLHNPLLVCTKLCHNVTRSTLCLRTQADESHQLQSHPHEGVSNLTYVTCIAHNTTQLYQEAVSELLRPISTLPSDNVLADVVNDGVYYEKLPEEESPNAKPKSLLSDCSTLLKKPLWNIVFNDENYDLAGIERELQDLSAIGGTGYMFNISDIFTEIGDFSLRDDVKIKFPDVIKVLHKLGFKTMIPVSPFVNYNSSNFRQAVGKRYLIEDEDATAPILTDAPQFGSNVIPGMIDFTNPSASKWFSDNIADFKEKYEIEYIHLFYGQASWLPKHIHLHNPLHNPGFYSTMYTNIGNYLSPCPVTDVAYSSQPDNQFVMLNPVMDMEVTLRVALSSGLAGYPFFIPNLPSHLEEATVIGRESMEEGFLRWIQLVSFFPVVHLPWDYQVLASAGVNMTRLTAEVKKYMSLRNGPNIWPVLEAAIQDAETNGLKPIISPIWMAPGIPATTQTEFDRAVFEIQDQYMIGNNLMFAPVLLLGQTKRDVYFPPGQWKDLLDDRMIPSDNAPDGHWKSCPANLNKTLIFVRINGTSQ